MKKVLYLLLVIALIIPLRVGASGIKVLYVKNDTILKQDTDNNSFDLFINSIRSDEKTTTLDISSNKSMVTYYKYNIYYYDKDKNIIEHKYGYLDVGKQTIKHEFNEKNSSYSLFIHPMYGKVPPELRDDSLAKGVDNEDYFEIDYKLKGILNFSNFKKFNKETFVFLLVLVYFIGSIIFFVINTNKFKQGQNLDIKNLKDLGDFNNKNAIDASYIFNNYKMISNYNTVILLELAQRGYIEIVEEENGYFVKKKELPSNREKDDKYFEQFYNDMFQHEDTISIGKSKLIIGSDIFLVNNSLIKKNEIPPEAKAVNSKFKLLTIFELLLLLGVAILLNPYTYSIWSIFIIIFNLPMQVISFAYFLVFKAILRFRLSLTPKNIFVCIVMMFLNIIFLQGTLPLDIMLIILVSLIYLGALVNSFNKDLMLSNNPTYKATMSLRKYILGLPTYDTNNNLLDILPYVYALNIPVERLQKLELSSSPKWFTTHNTKDERNVLVKLATMVEGDATMYVNKRTKTAFLKDEEVIKESRSVVEKVHNMDDTPSNKENDTPKE